MPEKKQDMLVLNAGPGAPGSLGIARFISWLSLLLIVTSSIILSLFVSSNIRSSLLDSQKEYALLLAENMNKQIFRRFSLPVAAAKGKISLSEKDQYDHLDEVIGSLMHGLRIESIRIYNPEAVMYSQNRDEFQSKTLAGKGVERVFAGAPYDFDLTSNIPYWRASFMLDIPDGSFVLKTVYPLTIDQELAKFIQFPDEKQILGALEIVQDVTSHYRIAIRAQRLILFGFIISTFVLFYLIQFVARRAENIIRERMEQNRKLEDELHQNERLAAMGRMVASIAHEIRNPLGVIKSSSEFLLRKNGDNPNKPLIEAVYDESRRLEVIVNDFLDFARPRTPGNAPVDPVSVINKARMFLTSSLDSQGVAVETQGDPGILISGDSDLLYRAFYNIIVNAQQAMNGPGKITAKCFERDGKVTVEFLDTGPGFKEEHITKVLDPFFTTKETGTGLGLSIVNNIVVSHKGSLSIKNAQGGGADIVMTFPKYDGPPGEGHE